jgi:hypothetical protein
MPDKTYSTIVVMPDNSRLEVDYYCMDSKLNEQERKNQTQLFIQLHDCICTLKIEKSICKNLNALENLVHNKVINTKGHLC